MGKILQIIDIAAPYKGNLIESMEFLELELSAHDMQVAYLFPSGARRFEWPFIMQREGRKVYFIDSDFFSRRVKIKNIRYLLHLIRNENIDLIHTNFVAYNFSLFLVKKVFKRNLKIIGQFQNHYIVPRNKYQILKNFTARNSFDRFIGVSDSVERSLLNASMPAQKVTTVFNSLADSRLKIFEKITLTDRPGQRIILMFGWPFKRKGVDIAVKAIKEINRNGNDMLLAISLAGGKAIVEEEIRKIEGEIPSWIRILDAREDVATYYNASDIFISPSREEGFTFAVLEAAFCNCLIAVSEIGGNPQDIPFTIKFKEGDVDGLKKAIINLLGESEERISSINSIQRNYVLMKYSIKGWARQIIEIYKAVLNDK